jgi:hypothetical protein
MNPQEQEQEQVVSSTTPDEESSSSSSSVTFNEAGPSTSRGIQAHQADYRNEVERQLGFGTWPAAAEFYYPGHSDAVRYFEGQQPAICYNCALRLHSWQVGEDAWQLLASFCPGCYHFLMSDGWHYQTNVADEHAPSSSTQVSTNTYALKHIFHVMCIIVVIN